MRSRWPIAGTFVLLLHGASPVFAEAIAIDLPAGRLAEALSVLGRQVSVDILFATEVVGDRETAGLRGQFEVGDALADLLAQTGLVYRRTADGTYIVATTASSLSQVSETIPEILVVGRRVQNADIRRRESDIQPYQVYTRRDVERAQSKSIDEFARTRLSANAQIAAPAQIPGAGRGTRSEINLRGLGPNQTLVLVDGRRLPSLPGSVLSFEQPDLNGLPIELIDRIEVLTATAGGVYGTGAMSGAVNVILRHDYRGAELAATSGLASRGDAFAYRLFGRVGFTPNNGRTDVMVAASHSHETMLRDGDRDYLVRAQRKRFANDPQSVLADEPVGNGINIIASEPLVLDTAAGGARLGSTFTMLPLGLGSDSTLRNTLLLANSGRLNLDQASTTRRVSVFVPNATRSIFVNVRHDFGGGIEAFFDFINTRNTGRYRQNAALLRGSRLPAGSPINPFEQAIAITFPDPYSDSRIYRSRIQTQRIGAGLIVPLPADWRANFEFGDGYGKFLEQGGGDTLSTEFENVLYRGRPISGRPQLDPLGDWGSFLAELPYYTRFNGRSARLRSSFRDAAARLAGPLISLPGGNATLTVVTQTRREKTMPSEQVFDFGDFDLVFKIPKGVQQVRSVYSEARLPLLGSNGPFSNLEAQIAIRQDWTRTRLPTGISLFSLDEPTYTRADNTTLYTLGAKFEPLPGLVFRTSTATGALPPSIGQLASRNVELSRGAVDPKRGNRSIGTEALLRSRTGGHPGLRPERARSLSFGAIVSPDVHGDTRFSVDLTRITKYKEIVAFPYTSNQVFIDLESTYPERFTRLPLSDADRELGFTGGPITQLDLTSINYGKTRIDTIDFAADHSLSRTHVGDLDFYLRATWEPTFRQRVSFLKGWINRGGYGDGPLAWRGNAGADWSQGRLTLGFNVQFYSRYRVVNADRPEAEKAQRILEQGSSHIPAQAYLDISGTVRLGPARSRREPGPELRWAVLNVLDHRPPTVVDPLGPGYSYYGDPRRRRFQVTLDWPFTR